MSTSPNQCYHFTLSNQMSLYHKCSREVKLRLFKSYCMGFYDIALWKHYNAGTINRLKSA